MRKKTIIALVSVYSAICLTYGAVYGVEFSSDADGEKDMNESTASQVLVTAAPETQIPTEETTVSARRKRHSKTTTVTEAPTEVITEEQTKPVYEDPEEIQTEEYTDPPVPSLEEYLSGLRCGGCGRGCSLLNPRCMRGARKQSSAESEYYNIYG